MRRGKLIHHKYLPEEAICNLSKYGELLPFHSKQITQAAIACHPDIFLCPIDDTLIVAPNTPDYFMKLLSEKRIPFETGKYAIGKLKQDSAHYNVVVTERFIIHNQKYTDPAILVRAGNRQFIHVNQGYTRCSLLPLKEDSFLTSDEGIAKVLKAHHLNCCYVSPEKILLPSLPYGFIGGCMGVWKNQVFVIGNLKYLPEGEKVTHFLQELGYEIVSLYDGKLFDGGSLFLVRSE